MKIIENNWLNLINLTSTELAYHLKDKKIFNKLVERRSSKFWNLEKIIAHDNLKYKYETEGRSPKDFRNYQNPVELFKTLGDINVNSNDVLKNKNNFKLDLGKIRKGNLPSKSQDQIRLIQDVQDIFNLREKNIIFLETILFCYMRLNTKQNMEI